jgi:hypothetical protein
MLENKNDILVVIIIVCTLDKKLSHGLVRDKNSCFVQSDDQFLNQTGYTKVVQPSTLFLS